MNQAEQDLENLRKHYEECKVGEPENAATLQEVNELAQELAGLRTVKEMQEATLSATNKKIEEINLRIIDVLTENQLKSYRAPAGLIVVKAKFTARLPQGPDREALFAYIKSIGREDMFSIHSATFNSWVKEQYDLAIEQGKEEPSLPGVKDVGTLPSMSFTRTK